MIGSLTAFFLKHYMKKTMNKFIALAVAVLFLYWWYVPAAPSDTKYKITSQAQMDAFLKQDSTKVLMLHAPWCGYCQSVKPDALNVARQTGRLMLVDGDTTFGRTLMQKYGANAFPTFVQFNKAGEKTGVQAGIPEKGIADLLQ